MDGPGGAIAGGGRGLELFLKYWRLAFPDGGAHVISPAVILERDGWIGYARYFLGMPDDDARQHAGMLRLTRLVGARLALWLGGGGGSGLDYLELREAPPDSHFWFAWAGAGYRLPGGHRLAVDWVLRREVSDAASLGQQTVTVGYELRL